MINIGNDIEFEENFIVLDGDDNPVVELNQNDFTTLLYNPSGTEVSNISGGISITISEVGSGIYKLLFTPNELGNWELIIHNNTYFPWGKVGHYKVIEATNEVLFIYLKRVLGLSKENIRLFSPIYNSNHRLLSCTFKTYNSKSDTENNINPIATYSVVGEYNTNDELINWKEIKE